MVEPARADSLELVVDQPLAEELERRGLRGVHAGDRVRFELLHGGGAGVGKPWPADWSGGFRSGRTDLGRRAKEIIRAEYGRRS